MGFSRQEYWSRLPFPSPMHEGEKRKWSLSCWKFRCFLCCTTRIISILVSWIQKVLTLAMIGLLWGSFRKSPGFCRAPAVHVEVTLLSALPTLCHWALNINSPVRSLKSAIQKHYLVFNNHSHRDSGSYVLAASIFKSVESCVSFLLFSRQVTSDSATPWTAVGEACRSFTMSQSM